MNRCCYAWLALATLWLLPAMSAGAVIERDWQSPGDGLLTYDTVNHREWLDLSETLLEQFPGSDLESQYQSVVAELAPGGMFEGFTAAKSDDVVALAESTGIDTTTRDFGANAVATLRLIELLRTCLKRSCATWE